MGCCRQEKSKGFLCLQGMDIPVFQRCALISSAVCRSVSGLSDTSELTVFILAGPVYVPFL